MAEWWAQTGWAWELATLGFIITATWLTYKRTTAPNKVLLQENHKLRTEIIDLAFAIRLNQDAFLALEKRVAELEAATDD